MKKNFPFIVFLFIFSCSNAQNENWLVHMGENAEKVLGDSIIYKYPQFTQGFVYAKDGLVSGARLNLNMLNGEMQFINSSGDTLALANENLIKYITIQSDTFYYSKVYVQSMYSNSVAKLAKLEVISPVNHQKTAAYGQQSSVSSINSASSYYSNNSSITKLNQVQEVVLNKKVFYFIGDRFNKFQPAFKKNILNMFNKQKAAIEKFIKDNNTQFNKADNLLKLVNFIEMAEKY